jgi:hypothetical protein
LKDKLFEEGLSHQIYCIFESFHVPC